MKYDPMKVQQEIEQLLILYPDLVEDEVLRADCIEGQTGATEFCTMLIRAIGSAKVVSNGLADYIGELNERKERFERRQEALRAMIFKVMNTADLKKMELPEATLSVRPGRPKVIIVNENELPKEFVRTKTEPNKIMIAAALGAHEHVPGAVLSNAEPTLAIRTR